MVKFGSSGSIVAADIYPERVCRPLWCFPVRFLEEIMCRFNSGSTRMLPVWAFCFVVGLMMTSGVTIAGQGATLKPNWDAKTDKNSGATPGESGFVVPLFDTSHYAVAVARNLRPDKVQPAAYDCRDFNQVPSVKNQGACGACYAFGSAGDLESRLLVDGLVEVDLSENSIKECHYQGASCNGGNQYMTMSYLSRSGAKLESCDPYSASVVACATGCDTELVVLDWSAVSGGTIPSTAVLKQYMLDNGPLHTTVYAGDTNDSAWLSQFNNYTGTGVLYRAGDSVPNHSVLLVGWDDDIAHAGGSGAWIVKNSWGTNWGGTCGTGSEDGYFYIAYGSASIGMYSSFVGAYMAYDDRSGLLSHDEGGYTGNFGGVGTTLWGMARHDVPVETNIHRIEFWTNDVAVDVDVYIYDSFNGSSVSGLLASELDTGFTEPGYHFVELTTPLPVTAGDDVYVVVKFTNETYTYPLCLDGDGPVDTGKSYYSVNGASWTSLAAGGADVTVRVRTSTSAVLSSGDIGEDLDPVPNGNVPDELRIDAAWPNPFNPNTNIKYSTPNDAAVLVTIHDLKGHHVRTLVSESQVAGTHQVMWDGRDDGRKSMPSGVYFCRVKAGDEVRRMKLALLK
jgi:C1A family cysteine protease